MNDQSGQQCKFLGAHTALCGVVVQWQLGCGPKTGGRVLGDIRGVKISLSTMQMPICQKRPNSRIPFSSPKCRPLHSAAQSGCPLSAATVQYRARECKIFQFFNLVWKWVCLSSRINLWRHVIVLYCPVKTFIRLTRTTILNYFKTTRNILFIDVSASRRKPSSGLASGDVKPKCR